MEVETASRTIRFKLNGQACSIASNPVTRTSDVLREELGLTGTKVGCDAGDCGACTILIDEKQRFACLTAAGQLEGCDVQTVEGLAKDGGVCMKSELSIKLWVPINKNDIAPCLF